MLCFNWSRCRNEVRTVYDDLTGCYWTREGKRESLTSGPVMCIIPDTAEAMES